MASLEELQKKVEAQQREIDRLLNTMDTFSRFTAAQASLDAVTMGRLERLER